MKNLSLIINAILAVAVGVLFYLHFQGGKTSTSASTTSKTGTTVSASGSTTMAYVDLDTLETYYNYYKDKKADFEKRQKNIESTLAARGEALQREVYDLQQRAATMTQAEGEATQQRLLKKKEDLEMYRDQMAQGLQSEMAAFNSEVNAKMDTILQDYNKDNKYSYILSYQKGGAILYRDKGLDITRDVIEALNKKDAAAKK